MGRTWPICTAGLLAGWQPAAAFADARLTIGAEDRSGRCASSDTATTLFSGADLYVCTAGETVRLSLPDPTLARLPHDDSLTVSLRSAAHPEIAERAMADDGTGSGARPGGTQAVMRACDILIAVGQEPLSLPELVERTGIPKPTCHRIATALVQRGLLQNSGRSGYSVGKIFKEIAGRLNVD